MDCLIFLAVSNQVAKARPPEAVVYVDDDDEEDEEAPAAAPAEEEHRLQRRRRQRHRRRQRERRKRRLLASGLKPAQVQAMEETVRWSERVLPQRWRPPLDYDATNLAFNCVGVVGVSCGALVAGWVGWALLLVGAVILMLYAARINADDWERRKEDKKRADAEAKLAGVRAVLQRTGNADLLPLEDW